MISGLCHKADENHTLKGYYTVNSGTSLQMFHYYCLLRNNPEECGSIHQVLLGLWNLGDEVGGTCSTQVEWEMNKQF
jgi:hypothetical protein